MGNSRYGLWLAGCPGLIRDMCAASHSFDNGGQERHGNACSDLQRDLPWSNQQSVSEHVPLCNPGHVSADALNRLTSPPACFPTIQQPTKKLLSCQWEDAWDGRTIRMCAPVTTYVSVVSCVRVGYGLWGPG